jgi:catechol 2,3-dioxygenase-like lactoylglutathione lyase family enzyme
MSYYFYENGKGYQYVKTTVEQEKRNDAGTSSLYYDDGNGFIRGYSGAGATSF